MTVTKQYHVWECSNIDEIKMEVIYRRWYKILLCEENIFLCHSVTLFTKPTFHLPKTHQIIAVFFNYYSSKIKVKKLVNTE